MSNIFEAVVRLDQVFKELNLQYAIIGGAAIQARGEPRVTRDIDVTVLVGLEVTRGILEEIEKRIPMRSGGSIEFSIQNRIYLGLCEGVPVDIGLGGFEFETQFVSRATQEQLTQNVWAPVVSAEDLIVMKVFAGRAKDWIDIRGVIVRQGDGLDIDSVRSRLRPLLELLEEPERIDRFDELLHSIDTSI